MKRPTPREVTRTALTSWHLAQGGAVYVTLEEHVTQAIESDRMVTEIEYAAELERLMLVEAAVGRVLEDLDASIEALKRYHLPTGDMPRIRKQIVEALAAVPEKTHDP